MYCKFLNGLLAIVLMLSASYTVSVAPAEFSADITVSDAKEQVSTGKVFIKGEKIRQETTVDDQSSITILRLDKKLSWTLIPDEKQYMEIALNFDPAHPASGSKDYEYTTSDLGTEKVNGYDCRVTQYTYKNPKYGIMIQWIAKSLNYPVRYLTKDSKGKVTLTVDYTNIKTGKLDDSLFEVPNGYSKFSLPFKLPSFK
jgi:outer membrane lipoprotein-sorting protein